MEWLNIRFWLTFQMAVDLVLVFLVVYFLRSMRKGSGRDMREMSREAGSGVIKMIEPLLRDADTTARSFEKQLKEKRRLINHLNESLDGRIISLNLLLNRADAVFNADSRGTNLTETRHVLDQQKAIIEQFNQGHDASTTARKLSIPTKEVEMVYDLKQKFIKLEQDLARTDVS